MASACVNNAGVTPGKLSAYGWLSPRVSFSRDDDVAKSKSKAKAAFAAAARENKPPSQSDLDEEAADFEFCLKEDPAAMLPADELISDGKLMPMQVSVAIKPAAAEMRTEVRSTLEMNAVRTRRIAEVLNGGATCGGDPYLFSPKAPRCTTRWKEILGLKKLQQQTNSSAAASGDGSANKLLKSFLHRSSKSSTSSSASSSDPAGLSLPLLRDTDCESLSMSSSRLSLSSSSSGHHDIDDFPRLSLDAEKQNIINPISLLKGVAGAGSNSSSNPNNPNPNMPRLRLVRSRPVENQARPKRRAATEPINAASLGPSVDSPRMNPSGKIVFQSLERSSSSPSSFNGGRPRFVKHSGMERSYSANVRVAPVLNVPVCSLRGSSSKSGGGVFGFGQLFGSSQHKRSDSNGGGSSSRGSSYQQVTNNSNSYNNSASFSRSSRSTDRA